MKNVKSLLSIGLLIMLSLTACKKYPEGPLVSIHSKTERVANNWKVGQALEGGKDVTSDYNKFELNLSKGGAASLSAKYVVFGATFEYTTEGRWVFVSNKSKLSLDFENDGADGVYTILKLEEDEMWLKQDGGTTELHLVTK